MIASLLALSAARTFFLSPVGDDAGSGLSRDRAWKSLARLSREKPAPGDQIVLLGGGTYEGSLELTNGLADRPIVIRSEGRRSTILSSSAPAITIRTGGVEIRDVILRGDAKAERKNNEGILLDAPKDRRAPHVRIEDVEIVGMGSPGISVMSAKGNPNGFDDVRIARAKIHGNYGVGIISADGIAFDSASTKFAHHDWRIVDCDTSENFDGAGIILSGVDRATVEFCRSANNSNPDGGGLGMWAWCARRVTFRYCVANGIRSKGDGGGYDLDGGTKECVVERCLSYDNVGPGAMHCDFPSAPRTERNAIQNNVSIDDGLGVGGGPGGVGFVVWGSGLYDCLVERNLVVFTKPAGRKANTGALFASFIRDGSTALENQKLEGALFRANDVVIETPEADFVRDNFPANVRKEVRYVDNRYVGAASFVVGLETPKSYDQAGWRTVAGDDARRSVPPLGDYKSVRPRDLPVYLPRLGR